MRIPLQDLSRSSRAQATDLARVCERVIHSGWFVLGEEVSRFEEEFAAFIGAAHAVTVGNGTDALELALRALEVGPGDDVLQAANAGMYGTVATLAVGARPVYADIDPVKLSPSVDELLRALTSRTKAVILTHLHGWAADVEAVAAWCQTKGIALIEDCAESHGAAIRGKVTGTFGQIGCFSFYPTKNLGALGDGGACCTQNPNLARRLKLLRQYGWERRYHATLPGGRNSRLDEIQAAILRWRLPRLNEWNARRRQIAQRYLSYIEGLPVDAPDASGLDYVGHLFVVKVQNRDELREKLHERGIATDVHFPIPDYRQNAVTALLGDHPGLAQTERACQRILTLPCFPELTDEEVDFAARGLRSVLTHG